MSNAEETSLRSSGVVAAIESLTDDHRLGRYELLCPIGRGGMAVVWCARQRGTRGFSKVVAVKTMLPMLSSDPRFERMFLAEAELASRIKHPNVCETYDLGEDRGILYLVMEWIDGEPLTTLTHLCALRDRDIPRELSAWLLAKAARGLAAAHELGDASNPSKGVVHRDVSPQNILVTARGEVKIVDFGVAKAAERSGHTTQTGLIKGKLRYLAPEQVERRDIDARVDTFALGTLLYEMTTGTHPFERETDLATLLAVSSADPIPMPGDHYPAELRAILERALAKDRDERYASMRAFAADLEAYAAAHGATEDVVTAFLGDVLAEPRAERAAELRAAIREADERSADSERDVAKNVVTASDGAVAPVALRPAPRSRAWPAMLLAALVGIAGLVWLDPDVRGKTRSGAAQRPDPIGAPIVDVPPMLTTSTTSTTSMTSMTSGTSTARTSSAVATATPSQTQATARTPGIAARPASVTPRPPQSPAPPSSGAIPTNTATAAAGTADPAAAPTVFHRPGF